MQNVSENITIINKQGFETVRSLFGYHWTILEESNPLFRTILYCLTSLKRPTSNSLPEGHPSQFRVCNSIPFRDRVVILKIVQFTYSRTRLVNTRVIIRRTSA